MNMSDDVASATINAYVKATESGIHIATKITETTIDTIARLLRFIAQTAIEKKNANSSKKEEKASSKTNNLAGQISMKDLLANARENGDTISLSKNGMTLEDQKFLAKKAKEYGIPIAFTNKKDKENIYAHVKSSDIPIFQHICTDMIKNKIESRPQELGNFKLNEWEIKHLNYELEKYDLSASFGKTKNGEHFCLYEKKDEKAILIARAEFIKKCSEVRENLSIEKDADQQFFILKDKASGKEISFATDKQISQSEISRQLQESFGYDENKANIAAARFGEECLEQNQKQMYFSDNPVNEFSDIQKNISLEDESIYCKNYECLRVTPKADGKPKIVFQDKNGNFAVVAPESMSKRKMAKVFQDCFGIKDKREIDALVSKASKIQEHFAKQDIANTKIDYDFSKSDFNMSDPDVVKNMRREENGNVYTRKIPVDNIAIDIDRISKEEFVVISTVAHIEHDQNNNISEKRENQKLQLSFSDEKKAIQTLKEMYVKQGVSEDIAKQMAKDTFEKAKLQSAEKIIIVNEVRADVVHYTSENTKAEIDLQYGDKKATIDMRDPKAAESIEMQFGVSSEQAKTILDNADYDITKRQYDKLLSYGFKSENIERWNMKEASEVLEKISKNNWELPKDINPETFTPERFKDIKIDKPDFKVPPISSRGGR